MANFLLAVALTTAMLLLCTGAIRLFVRVLQGDGPVPRTIDSWADRSIARAAASDLDREYEDLLAREGR